jgi:hypothetical protein
VPAVKQTGAIVLAIFVVGVCAMLDRVWVSFVWFGARAKEAECLTTLRSLVAQAAALDAGTPLDFDTLKATRGRYGYLVAAAGPRSTRDAGQVTYLTCDGEKFRSGPGERPCPTWEPRFPLPSGVVAGRTDAGLVIVCAGDIDGDEGFDIWSIADFRREDVPAGVPLHEVRDLLRYRNLLTRLTTTPPVDEVELSTTP